MRESLERPRGPRVDMCRVVDATDLIDASSQVAEAVALDRLPRIRLLLVRILQSQAAEGLWRRRRRARYGC